jgi:hypothetical protein
VNDAVAPVGDPAGVIVGADTPDLLVDAIDQAIVLTPLSDVSARLTVEAKATLWA